MIIKIAVYLILTVSGLLLFKMGGTSNLYQFNFSRIELSLSITSLIGIICYCFSFLLWLNIIKDNDLSYIFPIATGLVTVTTVLGGFLLLHEKVQLMQWAGIAIIIAGVFIINLAK